MNVSRFRRILISLTRFVAWLVALGIVVLLLDYSLDVSKRMSRGPACQWNIVPNPGNEPYVARYCHLTKDTVVLRLYDAKEEQLLAERMYFEQNIASVFWTHDALIYTTRTDDVISLPPTLLDRLRAKLP